MQKQFFAHLSIDCDAMVITFFTVGRMEAQSPRKLRKKRVAKMWIPLPEHLYKEFEVSKREQGVTVALHKNLHCWKEFEASINVKRSKLYRKS